MEGKKDRKAKEDKNEYFIEYMPQKMKVSNNNEYNQFLEKRGNVFHFIDEAIENWYENSQKVTGTFIVIKL